MITFMTIYPDDTHEIASSTNHLADLTNAMKCKYLEDVSIGQFSIFADEEGLFSDTPRFNRGGSTLAQRSLVGAVTVTGAATPYGDLTSLDEQQIAHIVSMIGTKER